MFTTKNPFTIITKRAQKLLANIDAKLNSGDISSRTALLVYLSDALSKFFSSIREPSMEVPFMQKDDQLIRQTVETPIHQATEDVELAYEQLVEIGKLNTEVFNLTMAETAGLKEQITELTALADKVRLWSSDDPQEFVWVSDTFNSNKQIDVAGSTVWVDTRSGTVTLKPTKQRSLSNNIQAARIDRRISRGGLPGNNLEIKTNGQQGFLGGTAEPLPEIWESAGDSDRLTNLFDGEPDTWFEWENYRVPIPQPVVTIKESLIYDPNGKPNNNIANLPNWSCYLRWPGDATVDEGPNGVGYPLAYFVDAANQNAYISRGGKQVAEDSPVAPTTLKLGLLLVLDQPRPVSWLQITPLIRGKAYPKIEDVLISFDGERWESVLPKPITMHPRMNRGLDLKDYGLTSSNYEGIGVVPIRGTKVKFVSIILAQDTYYKCQQGIAHAYNFNSKAKAGRTWLKIPIIGSYADTLKTADIDDGDDLAPHGRAVKKYRLRRALKKKSRHYVSYDIFKADRRAIILRDLLLEERLYEETGQLLSTPHVLDRAVRAVSLLATEQIPEEWDNPEEVSDWITYEVSPDGVEWFDIVPQRTQLADSVVIFDAPTKNIHFRATFKRPADLEGGTPLLQAYALKMIPIEETD